MRRVEGVVADVGQSDVVSQFGVEEVVAHAAAYAQAAVEALEVVVGEHFQAYLERIIKKVVEKHIEDDSDLADIVEKYAKLRDLSSRIEFLEKAVLNDPKIIETGGNNNGSDTTLE